uniref:B9 domain-containing protein 2 n=1 Tax=Florenciella parvula TaxID=236787 RepID=A0A7S2C8P0_9STRA|mmetsp:Transcript_25881/g.53481  ORF Transcript_25881/g.53481 Transcript_25881/m.53481 type:complete len:187 (+) Transcript_25881:128-688(+)|eukprot:CAMPEP_0119541966 /NCGR_PEP_ID=MMETSP1344-20130328/53293_1 /TAXON_ID=236787 /ORGANISM="Florenciella parvula, Strain CCMP2471" /LENGTH=186 /DNA_ID=CAMNT_0007586083 /DNA_START=418 /DNA_END=978 /DNA_ORIENTATION=+
MEVHLVGELNKAVDIDLPNLHCHWKMLTEDKTEKHDAQHWVLISGADEGFTQISAAAASQNQASAVWNHPLDMYYASSSVKKWPHMYIEIWSQDSYGRNDIAGYGVVLVPATPGTHELECVIWRPYGTFMERLSASFLGGWPQLTNPEKTVLDESRYPLMTETVGAVHITLSVVTSRTDDLGVKLG